MERERKRGGGGGGETRKCMNNERERLIRRKE